MTAALDVDTVTVATDRSAVDRLVAEGARIAGELGSDWAAAGSVLTGAPAPAVRELAQSKPAELIRARLRSSTLSIEREAEQPRPPKTRPRRGTRAYDWWATETEEGRAYEDEREKSRQRHLDKLVGKINAIVDDYKDQLRIEWTAQLLASEIAMPDGTLTTWGAATIEQHEARAAMFEANAVANAEGAARHLKAIDELRAAGVGCLRDLVASPVDRRVEGR